jgi:rhodanese-related sulfurtransferase
MTTSQQTQQTIHQPLRLDPAEAAAKIDAGEAIVLDVVSEKSWPGLAESVAGALRIRPGEIEARRAELPLPEERAVVAYCT